MKLFRLFTVAATAVAMTSTVSAQSRGAGAAKAPHVTTSAPKGQTTHGPKSGTPTGSAKSASTKKPADNAGKGAGRSKPSTSDETGTTSAGATAAADAAEPNALSIKINGNPAMLAKVQPQLDALGLTLEEATRGFRNQGQFIAALNASKNHQLDFLALQEAMTGPEQMSLGQAAKKVASTAPETPEGGTGTTGTGTTGTGTTGTGTTGTGTK